MNHLEFLSRMGIELLFVFLLVPIIISKCDVKIEEEEEMLITWKLLGWKNVLLVIDNNSGINKNNFIKTALNQSFSISAINSEKVNVELAISLNKLPIVLIGETVQNFELIKMLVQNGQPPYSTMLVSLSTEQENIFDSYFKNVNISLGFMFMKQSIEKDWSLFRIQTFRDQAILVQNKFEIYQTHLSETIDLKGAVINALDLAWMPYMRAYDCVNSSGIYVVYHS